MLSTDDGRLIFINLEWFCKFELTYTSYKFYNWTGIWAVVAILFILIRPADTAYNGIYSRSDDISIFVLPADLGINR